MKENIKLAWRNIWRNKRRTLITTASILFAVFFAIILRSFELGAYDHWINNMVRSYTGFLQIQQKDYWDDRIIENSFVFDQKLEKKILAVENVKAAVPRLESFSLASSGDKTKGVILIGIDPEKENAITGLSKKVAKYKFDDTAVTAIKNDKTIPQYIKQNIDFYKGQAYATHQRIIWNLNIQPQDTTDVLKKILQYSKYQGEYLSDNDKQVLVSNRLAKYLNLNTGDTIVLISQGYNGVSAAGKYRIKGIVRIPAPDIDARMIYMPLKLSQEFFDMPQQITSIAIDLKNVSDKNIEKTKKAIMKTIDTKELTVKTWKEMNKEIVQMIEADNSQGLLTLFILYIIIGFGILGTIIMMTAERKREFGVMVAIGMQKHKIAIIQFFEIIMIAILGIAAGVLLSAPFILYFHENPIVISGEMTTMLESYGLDPVIPVKWFDQYIVNQIIVVFAMTIIIYIYPGIKILKLNVIEALRR